MQLGDPPLYAEINRVCRNMDTAYLATLGPYVRCMGKVLLWNEKNKVDTWETGEQIYKRVGGNIDNLAGIFLLYSGAQMEVPWIYEYEKRRFEFINLPGNFSCSENLGIALEFAFKDQSANTKPVLLVISCQNYLRFNGVRMNFEAYSAYPRE